MYKRLQRLRKHDQYLNRGLIANCGCELPKVYVKQEIVSELHIEFAIVINGGDAVVAANPDFAKCTFTCCQFAGSDNSIKPVFKIDQLILPAFLLAVFTDRAGS